MVALPVDPDKNTADWLAFALVAGRDRSLPIRPAVEALAGLGVFGIFRDQSIEPLVELIETFRAGASPGFPIPVAARKVARLLISRIKELLRLNQELDHARR